MSELFPHAYRSIDTTLDGVSYFVIEYDGDEGDYVLLVGRDGQPEMPVASYCLCCSRRKIGRDLAAICGSLPVFARFFRETTPVPTTSARRIAANLQRIGDEFFAHWDRVHAEEERAKAVLH